LNTSLKDYLALFFAIIISLIFIYSNDNLQLQTFQVWLFELTGQVQQQFARITRFQKVYQQNLELQRLNTELALKVFQAQNAAIENARLREMLRIPPPLSHEMVVASVLGPGLNRNANTLLIDRGSRDGLKINDPVMTPAGLVGKILTVSRRFAQVHLLNDRFFRVSGRLQRSRVDGIVRWEEGDLCLLDHIPKRAEVILGDTVVTSGLGKIYPPGIPIGVVVAVQDAKGIFKQIKIKPAADLLKVEALLVLKTNQADSMGLQ